MGHDVSQAAKTSDQLPEEAPAEQVLDDVPEAVEGASRETARRHIKRLRERLSAVRAERDRDRRTDPSRDAAAGPPR